MMRTNRTKALFALWVIAAVCLLAYLGRQQAGFRGLPPAEVFDLHAVQHQDHVLLWKPWVIIPYTILFGSALVFLLGPGRNELQPNQRNWALMAMVASLLAYCYLLFFVR